jgi:F-type H+-transporting ATPase subunit b
VLIDWFTVAAQAVNFLILVWLLKKFLYGPLVRAMRARQDRIETTWEEAEAARREAEERERELQDKRKELRGKEDEIMDRAREKARQYRHEAEDTARRDVEEMRRTWIEELEQEKESFRDELTRRFTSRVLDVARRAVADLADADLQSRAADAFLAGLDDLDQDFEAGARVTVRVGPQLDDSARKRLEQGLGDRLGSLESIDFTVDESLGLGVEATIGGRKVSWSLAGYMEGLEETVLEPALPVRRGQ